MKSVKFFELVILALVGSLLVAFAHADPIENYDLAALKVESAQVPDSVSRSESVHIRMAVLYANTCYTIFLPAVRNGASNLIEIFPRATVKKGMLCGDLATVVDKEVDLDGLNEGNYLVRIHNAKGPDIDKTMIIR